MAFAGGQWLLLALMIIAVGVFVLALVADIRGEDLFEVVVFVFFVALFLGIMTFLSGHFRAQNLQAAHDLNRAGYTVVNVDSFSSSAKLEGPGGCVIDTDLVGTPSGFVAEKDNRVLHPQDLKCN